METIITIIGTTPPCVKCRRAEQEALNAAAELGGEVLVQKIDALAPEAEAFGMVVTPAVVVNGTLVANGRVVPAAQLVAHIQKTGG